MKLIKWISPKKIKCGTKADFFSVSTLSFVFFVDVDFLDFAAQGWLKNNSKHFKNVTDIFVSLGCGNVQSLGASGGRFGAQRAKAPVQGLVEREEEEEEKEEEEEEEEEE